MLVEDNPADIGLVREALDEHGVDCVLTVISDGQQAVDFIEQADAGQICCPQLILLDLKLPKRTGHEILQAVRASVTCRQVPVVILSSSDARIDREEAARLGATWYIRKPQRLEEYLQLGHLFKTLLESSAVA